MGDCFRRGATRALCAAAGLFAVMASSQADGVSAREYFGFSSWPDGSALIDQAGDEPKEIVTQRFVVSRVGRARP